ncbi:DEAD/DEAH box helicase domain containing protein, putative [Babesia bigemina]|uniref:DEAD/DEAH box helicase domain containing protein, putative n=1 Tax=Babesia bigemina TaxID=5866 RepID=A0A061D9H6_BABBI|nr:DEAD/DEAH box helicase domain containing protein, putative [Babesia bigemina]CDR97316.1 DEAD/DEAH box helicase domain containing protein, putative [Babesia bigemina]|eukprot:XP_012769502.1 DEAD/DEAH box helicase domain containing protein, putative [Babesia bigemina]
MKRVNTPEAESDDDQGLSLEFEDGFFDFLGDSSTGVGRDGHVSAPRSRSAAAGVAAGDEATAESLTGDKATARQTASGKVAADEPSPNAADGAATAAKGADSKADPAMRKHLTSTSNWSDFGIARSLIKVPSTAVFDMGYEAPSIIQSKVIPVALEGKDLLATAETGSGKSAAFLIPTLQRLINAGVIRQDSGQRTPWHAQRVGTKALILLPTRELAAQCFDVFLGLTKYVSQNGMLLTGGVPVKDQEARLRRVPYIVFATPGKVLDIMLNSNSIHMDGIEIVVLDEADRLLDLGFKDELTQILKLCNKDRQTMLFSATLTEATKEMVPVSLVNPIYIQAAPRITVAKTLKCEMIQLPNDELREAAALYLCKQKYTSRTILFFQTKKAAHRAAVAFGLAGLKCGELHGDLSQSKRFEQVEMFKDGRVNFLMASELASRGLDIPGVRAVINVHVPTDVVRFVHRVGRTARMGESGTAITFYVESERSAVKSMMKRVAAEGSGLEKQKIKLSTAALNNYKRKIEELEDKIKEVLMGEQVEKEMRRCENVIKHGSEQGKEGNLREAATQRVSEKRMWFRTKREKRAASKKELVETRLRAGLETERDPESPPRAPKKAVKRGVNPRNPPKKGAAGKGSRAGRHRAGRR